MKAKFFPGQHYGDIELVRRSPSASGKAGWLAKCKCGITKIVNATDMARKPPACKHQLAQPGDTVGDYVVDAVVSQKPFICRVTCKTCGRKEEMGTTGVRMQKTCPICKRDRKRLHETETHITVWGAKTALGISRQRVYMLVDAGILDSERVDGLALVVKNQKWFERLAWTENGKYGGRGTSYSIGDRIGACKIIGREGKKWRIVCSCGRERTTASPGRYYHKDCLHHQPKHRIGDVIDCWTVTGRTKEGLWQFTCECGLVRESPHSVGMATKCCHSFRLQPGAVFGRLTVCSPLAMSQVGNAKKVLVECKCGHIALIDAVTVLGEKYRKFKRCGKCKQHYED